MTSFARPIGARNNEQPIETAADCQIYDPEIKGKQKYGDDHNRRRRLNFFARRRVDFPHLRAHIVVETPDALRPGLDPVSEVVPG